MRKFNWEKFRKVFWFFAAMLVIVVVWPLQDTFNDDIHTNRFCAYGQVYAEFEHNGKIWGTTFLDENGHPISCTDERDVGKHTSINARNII